MLRINSPGGSVAATQEIVQEIRKLRKNNKVVVASMGDVAASGGYYIASQADSIVADPGTLTGSIGVIMQIANVQDLFKKIGVKTETIKSGKFKDIGSPFRELSVQERDIFQNLINDAYDQFVTAVAEGRKMDRAKVLEVADGRIFTGTQAKAAGLIDEYGNLQEAILLAASKAGITGKPNVVYDSDSFERFLKLFSESSELKFMSEMIALKKVRLDYMLE